MYFYPNIEINGFRLATMMIKAGMASNAIAKSNQYENQVFDLLKKNRKNKNRQSTFEGNQ